MPTADQIKAALASFLRIFAAALVPAIVATWQMAGTHDWWNWSGDQWQAFAWAVLSAAVLTAINALRKGDTRFGRNAQVNLAA